MRAIFRIHKLFFLGGERGVERKDEMLMRKKDRNRLRQSERERERARARICSVQKRHNEEDDKTATSKGKVSEERLTQQVN